MSLQRSFSLQHLVTYLFNFAVDQIKKIKNFDSYCYSRSSKGMYLWIEANLLTCLLTVKALMQRNAVYLTWVQASGGMRATRLLMVLQKKMRSSYALDQSHYVILPETP